MKKESAEGALSGYEILYTADQVKEALAWRNSIPVVQQTFDKEICAHCDETVTQMYEVEKEIWVCDPCANNVAFGGKKQ